MEDWSAVFKFAILKLSVIACAKREELVGKIVFSKDGHRHIARLTCSSFSGTFRLLS